MVATLLSPPDIGHPAYSDNASFVVMSATPFSNALVIRNANVSPQVPRETSFRQTVPKKILVKFTKLWEGNQGNTALEMSIIFSNIKVAFDINF